MVSDDVNQEKLEQMEEKPRERLARLEREVERLRRAQATLASGRAAVEVLSQNLADAQKALTILRSSPIYRLMVKIGRWRWLEPLMDQVLGADLNAAGKAPRASAPRIVIDLTPIVAGGDNGGAKLVAIGLVRQLAELAPDWQFILLTSGRSHDELASLDRPNVRRECVVFQDQAESLTRTSLWTQFRMKVGRQLMRRLPPRLFDRLHRLDTRLSSAVTGASLLRRLGADLYFCVFTCPHFYDPSVPVVSTVYDLQYQHYPMFFSPRELHYRDQHFAHTVRTAAKLVCISDYVRHTVLERIDDPQRVLTSHIRLWKRIEKPAPAAARQQWEKLGLTPGRYLFYPANFWAHKNHAMLLTAFGIYRKQHPESDLKLVFSGAAVGRMGHLRERAVTAMGLGEQVVFAGFLPDEGFAALLEGCRAMIFPSLYEGFGMPVIEAMAFGKPVACSNVTSLPEVAGEAALLFDPRRPAEIVETIERLERDDELVAGLVQKGYDRVRAFGQDGQMAREYIDIFKQVLGSRGPFVDAVVGLHSDGWSTDQLRLTYAPGEEGRLLEMDMAIPQVPAGRMNVRYCHNDVRAWRSLTLDPESGITVRQPLDAAGGFIDMEIGPLYRAADIGRDNDDRELGFMCQRCRIVHPDGQETDLLEMIKPPAPRAEEMLV